MSNNISFCALDLETTGLNSQTDQIIEIGLQPFTLDNIGQSYSTYVKPSKGIPKTISVLTGISDDDVKHAPSIEKVKKKIQSFIGEKVIVGHNVRFDLSFLSACGIEFNNESCDTLHLSYMIEPSAPDYTLTGLANYLDIPQEKSHRALADSVTCMQLLKKLFVSYLDLPISTAAQIAALHQRGDTPLNKILTRLLAIKLEQKETGLNILQGGTKSVSKDNELCRSKDDNPPPKTVDEIFANPDRFSMVIPDYENREGQMEMARMVEDSLKTSSTLIIEAGTGIGKSMAYLMPSIIHGLKTRKRVVVSTNTINLQDQLMEKDIPAALSILGINGHFDNKFSFHVLKGSRNYLCKRRLETQVNRAQIDADQAIFFSKILVWLSSTDTGDKSEINLNRRGHDLLWSRINGDSSDYCGIRHGNCFLRKARDLASESDLLVVNHSLLMANIKSGMTIIPDHDCLILDEAHHLEKEATNAFGFEITSELIQEIADRMSGGDSILDTATRLIKNQTNSKGDLSSLDTIRSRINTTSEILKNTVTALLGELSLAIFDSTSEEARLPHDSKIRIVSSHRNTVWNDVTLLANKLSVGISSTVSDVESLVFRLSTYMNIEGTADMVAEINNIKSDLTDFNNKLVEVTLEPVEDSVYWITRRGNRKTPALCMAPTEIATKLTESLYDRTPTIVMTSATLTSNDDFNYFVTRTGFQPDASALIPSPFPYSKSTVLMLARDIPDPRQPNYYSSLAKIILESAEGAQGKTLCLFTSHSSIRRVFDLIHKQSDQYNLEILAQGISGSTQNILKRLREGSNCVVLGTSALWEGIDIKGDALQLLIITRLPFEVPTDPIYQARSESYDNPFIQYALPNAILRFRQGFGRLIRSSTDRGVALILDSRISKSRYGRYFVNSLPEMNLSQLECDQIGRHIEKWLYQ